MTTTLAQVRAAQPEWFSRKNKRFFGDVGYKVLHDSKGQAYLVRSTYAWTDMFGQPRTLHYRVNKLDADLKIRSLVNQTFRDLEHVKQWLRMGGEYEEAGS